MIRLNSGFLKNVFKAGVTSKFRRKVINAAEMVVALTIRSQLFLQICQKAVGQLILNFMYREMRNEVFRNWQKFKP